MVGLSSYKLVQFLKEYINPKEIEILGVIYSYITQTWLCKLRFVYKEVRKDVFIDNYKWPDIVKNRNHFLTKKEKLKLYIVKFNEDSIMKAKDYPVNYIVKEEEHCLIIKITHDECIFSTNDLIQKAWTQERDTFLRPKGQGQRIMTSDFLFSFG